MTIENLGTTTPETTTPDTTAPVDAPATQSTESTPAVDTPAWTPDWKYKFSGQEKEVDEMFRPIAKDQASLDRVKDILQRSEALEQYKPKVKDLETRIAQEYAPVVQTVQKLQQLYAAGDDERLMEELGMDDERLFKLVQEKLRRRELPVDQRESIADKRRLQLEKEELLAQNEQYRSQADRETARATEYELDFELGKADYQQIREVFERANGPGSFKALVIQRGAYHVERAGKHIKPSDLIPMVAKEFAPFVGQVQGTATPAEIPNPQVSKPKVIPQVGRGAASPAQSQIRSLDDLKKRAAAM